MLLSICIATMNRPKELGETLSIVLPQVEGKSIEVVVVDSTPLDIEVAGDFAGHPNLKVIRLGSPNGVDQDYAAAVTTSSGEYCWLLTDDDHPTENAINEITERISARPGLVLANAEIWNEDYSKLLSPSMIPRPAGPALAPPVTPTTLAPLAGLLTFIGSIVIRRDEWERRQPSRFFGSEFAHVGAVLSAPFASAVPVIDEPIIRIRYGRGHWHVRWARIWWHQWPDLIDSLVEDPAIRSKYYAQSDWRRLKNIAMARACAMVSRRNVREYLSERPLRSRAMHAMSVTCSYVPQILLNYGVSVMARLGRPDYRRTRSLNLAHGRALLRTSTSTSNESRGLT